MTLKINSFLEIGIMHHTIQPFKVYNSMVFSKFTELCIHYHNFRILSLKTPKEALYCLDITPHSSIPPALGNY